MNPQDKIELLCYRFWLLMYAILGEIKKILIDTSIIKPHKKCVTGNITTPDLIVSLTTYGRRVQSVYYTIVSLMRQTMKPDMIILWLDYDNWNESNIPMSLKKLQQQGLTIKYCKDLKSYKKLIPALNEYPDAMIVTCDDDIYYRSNMVERLVKAFKADPTKIYAHRAHQITFTNGYVDSYNNWPEEISDKVGVSVFPTSGGGTLYKKNLLHADICNETLFMKLSPKADDVWHFFMGNLEKTQNVVLPYKGYIYLPLDVFYQALHKGSNLASSNFNECMNDKQIQAIMEHYNIESKELQDGQLS